MISAEHFARRSSIWTKIVPSLDQYTRWANTNLTSLAQPLPTNHSAERSALISEAAFEAFVRGHAIVEAEDQDYAHALLSRLPAGSLGPAELSAFELDDAQAILWRLISYSRNRSGLVFRPRFDGCGIVDAAEGDFVLASELVEVKSVARSLRGSDFCQLLTYSALAHASRNRIDFESLTILNARTGHRFSFETTGFALDVGRPSWVELLDSIVAEMSGASVSS